MRSIRHKEEGGDYLGEIRQALEHLEAARPFASYSTRHIDSLIRATKRHIKNAEEEE